jgi:Putative ATP-dependent DNA helicase recG C-terminal
MCGAGLRISHAIRMTTLRGYAETKDWFLSRPNRSTRTLNESPTPPWHWSSCCRWSRLLSLRCGFAKTDSRRADFIRRRTAGRASKVHRIKLHRDKTTAEEGTRDTLAGDPSSVEGHAYAQIHEAVSATAKIIESVRVNSPDGLESAKYPITALHEIITNAVLHRDYSIADDIHIRVFDNRVEVLSPGTLPAHITPENILNERFARNAAIVRLINKLSDPPNKDVGEGLNTAFLAMREMKLKPPVIEQAGGSVKAVLRHEPLATPEEMILGYLQVNDSIANRIGVTCASSAPRTK